jgi:hypothetical protein
MLRAWFAASAPHYNVEAVANARLIPAERRVVFYLETTRSTHGSCVDVRQPGELSLPLHSHLTP